MSPSESTTQPAAHCTQCGGPVYPGDRFCGGCGFSLTLCAACGGPVGPDAPICASCGAALKSPPAPAAPVTPPAKSETDADSSWAPVVQRLRAALADEFEIDAELGQGGMAAVFRARELALNRRVAIKVMAPGLLLGDGMVDRFRQEAITVANLQHANIVAVHSVRTIGDLQLFVMQYIPGRSLDRVLRDHGRVSLQAARAIMYHVGSALEYAHRRGVVHRDIKPANVLLDADGDPVVTDFGIAKVAEAPGHTRIGTVVGTPTYMSPEQCLGYDVGPASDQYALGVVIYELLTGQPPFGGNGMAMMRAHTETPPPSLRRARAEIPNEIESAVLRMLAKAPEDRFPDLSAAITAFDAHPLRALGPVRAEMTELAGASNAETHLAEIVRAPRSPAPASVSVRGRVASIEIAGPSTPVDVGDCVVLSAIARSESGDRVTGARVQWSSSNQAIATVDVAGVLTALAPGLTTIRATSGAVVSTVDVVTAAAGVASIDVNAPSELRSGVRTTLTARALDRHGVAMDVPVSWTSRTPTIATISALGTISPKRQGTAVVVAEAGGVTRAVSIPVAPAPVIEVTIDGAPPVLAVGSIAALRAVTRVARGDDGAQARQVEWTSSDTSVATVSREGVVTAVSPGQSTITASCDGVRSTVAVAVVNVRAASVVITAPPGPVRLGDVVMLKAVVYDANQKAVSRPVTWRSTDSRVAPVDQSGRVVAQAEGWAIVTAEADGVDAHVELVVRQQVIPVSTAGRRELRSLAIKWWLLLAAVAGVLALGWRYLRR